ncbi:hypothetical protein OROHE_002129 [Orobanche hederae]
MMICYPGLMKLKTKPIVYENVLLGSDSSTLEQLKELSSKRKAMEESINANSHVTEAIAREMSGGLTSRCEQDVQKVEHYLPLLENLVHNIDVGFKNHPQMVCSISNLKIRWITTVVNPSSIFHLKAPNFHQINDIHFELGMTLFLYGSLLRGRALEVLSSGKHSSYMMNDRLAPDRLAPHISQNRCVYDYIAREVRTPKIRGEDGITKATSYVSSVMSLICLADAQGVTARKSEENGNSDILLAKLHYGITEFLGEAIEMLQAPIKDCKDISSRIMDYIMNCKTLHKLKCYKHVAENHKSEGKIGIAVGLLRRELSNAKKSVPKDETQRLVFKQVMDDLSIVLRKYEHENEFVWREKVPTRNELPSAHGVKIVSLIPYQPHKFNGKKHMFFKL